MQLQAAAKADEDEDEELSHLQFLQLNSAVNRIAFKQSQGKLKDVDLREVILLDSCSTVNLFCNRGLVHLIKNSSKPLKLLSNGGLMMINKIVAIGDGNKVWYLSHAVMNILSLKFVFSIYHVTYDSCEESFVVYRKDAGMPNMEFRMHHSGLHLHDPREYDLIFVNTVDENKIPFSQ